MRTSRTVTIVALALALSIAPLAGLTAADDAPTVAVHAEPGLGPTASTDAAQVPYHHYDCVGPGPSPVVADQHTPDPHTETVEGFQSGAGSISFQIVGFSLFTTGTCPVEAVDGPVLSEDFTGHYRVEAVCADGTTNPGTVFMDWELDLVAGLLFAQDRTTNPCYAVSGSSFALDVTVEISRTDALLGVPIGPAGGIDLTVAQ